MARMLARGEEGRLPLSTSMARGWGSVESITPKQDRPAARECAGRAQSRAYSLRQRLAAQMARQRSTIAVAAA